MQYISINTRGLRKILNNFDRKLDAEAPEDGCVTLEVERPHHPGHNSFQVCMYIGMSGSPKLRRILISSHLHASLI